MLCGSAELCEMGGMMYPDFIYMMILYRSLIEDMFINIIVNIQVLNIEEMVIARSKLVS